ncbi:hypothetical protein [Streptomyces sp. NPDC002559]
MAQAQRLGAVGQCFLVPSQGVMGDGPVDPGTDHEGMVSGPHIGFDRLGRACGGLVQLSEVRVDQARHVEPPAERNGLPEGVGVGDALLLPAERVAHPAALPVVECQVGQDGALAGCESRTAVSLQGQVHGFEGGRHVPGVLVQEEEAVPHGGPGERLALVLGRAQTGRHGRLPLGQVPPAVEGRPSPAGWRS